MNCDFIVPPMDDDLSGVSKTAAVHLALAYRALNSGRDSERDFQARLTAALQCAQVQAAPRGYRAAWTEKYQRLLGDGTGDDDILYNYDVLAAAINELQPLSVNGDVYYFSQTAKCRAKELRQEVSALNVTLRCCLAGVFPQKQTWTAALAAVDTGWAAFEEVYVQELMKVEQMARRPLQEAVELELRLSCVEVLASESAVHAAHEALVSAVARLNTIANPRGKGRGDLRADVLRTAVAATLREDGDLQQTAHGKANEASVVLARRVLQSFKSLRKYLSALEGKIDTMDPMLGKNPRLAERLEDWESSWEVGDKYLLHAGRRNSLCQVVNQVEALHLASVRFAELCESCDAELFFILPRIVLIVFLLDPAAHEELVRDLLPDKFLQGGGFATDVASLLSRLQFVRDLAGSVDDTWKALELVLVAGPSCQLESMDSEAASPPAGSIREFARELEGLSMELQRTSPQEWNQFSGVLMNCFTLERHA